MKSTSIIAAILFIIASTQVAPTGTTAVALEKKGDEKKDQPPNVVLIISDDQAWTDFGFMGHDVICTPNLDRLARESATFTRGYVPTSLCRASLASIITGLYPHQHKITSNDPPQGIDRTLMLRHIQAVPTFPRMLAEDGYRSLQTGKWWEGHYSLGGFTAGMTHGDPARRGRHGDEGLAIGREGMEPIYDFIEAAGEQPFFVWYAPMLPHAPHTPPSRLLEKYTAPDRPEKLAKYYAMCEWFDETCGALLKYLDDHGLSDNTLVVFVVDNGWIQETGPQRTTRGWFAPKSKLSPYDGGIRTPIMLRWPGHIKPARYETLASSIDLAPTILAACSHEVPDELPGINLLDVCAGKKTDREAVFGAIYSHNAVDIDNPAANLSYRWCVKQPWKLIVPNSTDADPELYNLDADPMETNDVAKRQGSVVKELTVLMDGWWPGR